MSGSRRSRQAVALVVLVLAAVVAGTRSAVGGTPPTRADRNLGWVLSGPRVHYVAWDNDWDAHNPMFPVLQLIAFAKSLATSGYFTPLAEYGVGQPQYGDYHSSSSLCGQRRAPASVSSAKVAAWITCEIVTPGTHIPYPGSRAPASNDVYLVLLPSGTTVSDNYTIPKVTIFGHTFGPYVIYVANSCSTYAAYHGLSFGGTAVFTYAVLPAQCQRSFGEMTESASHELVEAAVDPIPTAGWIDDSISLASPDYKRLSSGELGDICSRVGAAPASPALKGGFWVVPYWSNARGRCTAG